MGKKFSPPVKGRNNMALCQVFLYLNILNNGANIKTVASLLGHSGLSQTEKYTRAVDSLKEAAINSLPELQL